MAIYGGDVVEAEREARRAADTAGAVYCSPYNDLQARHRTRRDILNSEHCQLHDIPLPKAKAKPKAPTAKGGKDPMPAHRWRAARAP